MLEISKFVSQWLGGNHVVELAERVAGRSRLAVWQRVAEGLSTLGPTEAKGYLRARAIGVVHDETNRLVEQEGAKAAKHRVQIEEAALQMLIRVVLAQVHQRRKEQGVRWAA